MKLCEYCSKENDGSFATGRFCCRSCSYGFSTKAKRIEINKAVSISLSIVKIKKICPICEKEFEDYPNGRRKTCSGPCGRSLSNKVTYAKPGYKEKLSNAIKLSYINGREVAGGRAKWLKYKDINVQGSFEFRACKILDSWKDNNLILNWGYTRDRFQYINAEGKTRTYIIDFKIFDNDGSFYYLEVKGYKIDNDNYKWNEVRKTHKLEVWYKEEIKKYEEEINAMVA